MPSINDGIISASFSIGSKDSGGSFTVSGTIVNNYNVTISNPRLSISLNNSSWTRLGPSSLGPYGSWSGSTSISSGNTSSQTVYIYLLRGSSSTGTGGSYSVEGYVDPTPAFAKKTISISPTTQTMGNTLSISDSSGTGVTSTSHTWTAGNSTGSFSTGNWTIPIDDFEPLCPNAESISATFTTYSSGPGGSGSSSKAVTLLVPSNYVPTATHEAVLIDPVNYSLVAGISKLRIELQTSVLPEGLNSATVVSTALKSVTSSNPAITTSLFTKDGDNYTSGLLPTSSGAPSYTIRLTFTITDSRGRTADYTTGEYKVTNFIPPYCQITNLHRDTSNTGTLDVTITSPSPAYSAKVKVGSNTPVDVMNLLVPTQDGYTLEYPITGLQSGEQYTVVFYYKDTNMNSYGENEYAYSQLLSTMSMPLSLFDNGSRIAASFGEECADNYGEDVVINFAKDSYIRFIDGNTPVIEKVEYLFRSCPFPVGGIYMSVDNTTPSTLWPGTSWLQLQDRFLLGAGSTYTAGATGGEATHTLTIDEMPAHTHSYNQAGISDVDDGGGFNVRNAYNTSSTSGSTGGGQAHNNMPPYLVVYMWERIS